MKIKEKLEKEASLKKKLQQEIKRYKKEPRLDLKCDVSLSTLAKEKLQTIQEYEKEILEMIEKRITFWKHQRKIADEKLSEIARVIVIEFESLEKEIVEETSTKAQQVEQIRSGK